MRDEKIEFASGNISKVLSDGEIVYRDIKPQSYTIHRLLKHLEGKGFDFSPRFIDTNEYNQEMFSYVNGSTMEDYPEEQDLQKRIETVHIAAKLLKTYHDSTLDFEKRPDDIWFLEYNGELEKEVICHNDFAPYNVTFEKHRPVGMIDFDTACPAPRVWDVAYAIYRFVPLSQQLYVHSTKQYREYKKEFDCSERKILLKEFLTAYGIGENVDIFEFVNLRLQSLVNLFDEECKKGNVAFMKMKEEGHQDFYIREIEFINENKDDWK